MIKCINGCMPSVFLLHILLIAAGCGGGDQKSETKIIQEVQNRAGLNFPSSVSWLGCRMDRGQDDYFFGSFNIKKEDISGLLPNKKISWSTTTRHMSDNKEAWFKPDTIQHFKSTEIKLPDQSVLRLLYNDGVDSDTTTTMYIEWFET